MTSTLSRTAPIQEHIDRAIQELFASFPNPDRLSAAEAVRDHRPLHRGARGQLHLLDDRRLSLRRVDGGARDHPQQPPRGGSRQPSRDAATVRHGRAAIPTDRDALAVSRHLHGVREFVGRLSGARIVIMMAFFEGFIQRFMPISRSSPDARAPRRRSTPMCTAVCDVAHTQELFHALEAELALIGVPPTAALLEGVGLLTALLQVIVHGEEGR